MTVAEAIEMVLALARTEFRAHGAKQPAAKQAEQIRAIEIVETIVLYHYKEVDTRANKG